MNDNGQILYQPIIFKFTQQIAVNDLEFQAFNDVMREAKSQGKGDIVLKTICKGSVVVMDKEFMTSAVKQESKTLDDNVYEQNHWAYYIQEQLGETLEYYID